MNTSVGSGGGNGRPNGYYRPYLRQNFSNYGHNGQQNNYSNGGGGRHGGYNNNNTGTGTGGGYNNYSGNYHNSQNGYNNRRNYGNKRHYPAGGDYFNHQNSNGYHHQNNHNYPRTNPPLHHHHQNHNYIPNGTTMVVGENGYPTPTTAPPNVNRYHHQPFWQRPSKLEDREGYKRFGSTAVTVPDPTTPGGKENKEELAGSQPSEGVTLEFDVNVPPPSTDLTVVPPLPPYPPTWIAPPPVLDYHSVDTESSNSDDSLKECRLPRATYWAGYGDSAGKIGFYNYGQFWQPEIDPEQLVKSFKYSGMQVTLDMVAPKGSEWSELSESIWNKFETNQQTTETFRKKMELWRDLFDIIRVSGNMRIFPSYGLQIVGSTMSGFGSNTSDVDMCLLIKRNELDQRYEAIDCLHNLWTMLQDMPFLDKADIIYAKVPLIKLHDRFRDLEVDLNCNNSVGIRNTHLLYCYSQQDWRVRPLVLIVKMWAQYHGINDAKNMTISSYSLVLMVIHFLQHAVSPPVLPCLQQSLTDKYCFLMDLVNVKNRGDVMEPCFAPPEPFESENKETLGELLVAFLHYFAAKFDYSADAVSVRTGSVVSIKTCMNNRARKNDAHQWKYICIEEPFEFTNTARSVYDRDTFDRIRGVFFASWQRLIVSNNLDSIFSAIQITEARLIGARLRENNMPIYKKVSQISQQESQSEDCDDDENDEEEEDEEEDPPLAFPSDIIFAKRKVY